MGGQIKDYEGRRISGDISKDLPVFREIFAKDSVLRVREFHSGGDIDADCAALYFDGMVNSALINDSIIKPMVGLGVLPPDTDGGFKGDKGGAGGEIDLADIIMRRVLY